jgi:hypothetical protein
MFLVYKYPASCRGLSVYSPAVFIFTVKLHKIAAIIRCHKWEVPHFKSPYFCTLTLNVSLPLCSSCNPQPKSLRCFRLYGCTTYISVCCFNMNTGSPQIIFHPPHPIHRIAINAAPSHHPVTKHRIVYNSNI